MNPNQKNERSAFTFVDFVILVAVVVLLALVAIPLLARRYAPYSSAINCTNNLRQIGLAYRQWAIDHGGKFPMQVAVTNGGAMEWVSRGSAFSTFLVMSNELLVPKLLICPKEDRKRVVANTFEQFPSAGTANNASQRIAFTNDDNVSYFVGMDAEEAKPSTLLGGDDNFSVNGRPSNSGLLLLRTNSQVAWTKQRHNQRGNFLFGDGSVAATTNPAIQTVLIKTGMATNRLALP